MKVLGYSDRISVLPGETIRFMVSCEGPKAFRADIVRIVCGDENPAGPGYREELVRTKANRRYPGRKQEINPGSYAIVEASPRLDALHSFTVQALIWPTTPAKGEQVIVAKWSAVAQRGFQLLVDDSGALAFKLGAGKGRVAHVGLDRAMVARQWYFVAASYDAATGCVVLHQEALEGADAPVRRVKRTRPRLRRLGPGPLTFAAVELSAGTERRRTVAHFNGKIERPRLADRALTRAEMAALVQSPVPAALRPALVGAWDFAIGISTEHISDISGNGLQGRTVNLPARAMTGSNWQKIEMRWSAAPEQWGAIHFHDDDLADADWEPDFALTIPASMKSGCYAARLRAGGDEDYIPFYVRPPRGKPSAKIAYLAATATYTAYGNYLFVFDFPTVELLTNRVLTIHPWEQYLKAHREFGGSLYECHRDGSGICYSSRLRPLINMRPKVKLSLAATGSELWGYNADTHLTDWIEAQGFAYDVITDEDLHAEGVELLRPYRVVITGSHPEYCSTAMWEALKAYTEGGGRMMYMGGNGFYWHIAYHPSLPGVIEVRRTEGSSRSWRAAPGEHYESFSGEHGGLLRHQARTPQMLTGAGMTAQGFDFCVPYRRTPESFDPRVSFAFAGIAPDELIGDFGLIGGGAAGLEVDMADYTLGTPAHALIVARADALSDTYLLLAEQSLVPMPNQTGTMHDQVRADLVFHETARGGAVFAFSSIAWCGSLAHRHYDNNVSRLTGNVLRRFLADAPFAVPDTGRPATAAGRSNRHRRSGS